VYLDVCTFAPDVDVLQAALRGASEVDDVLVAAIAQRLLATYRGASSTTKSRSGGSAPRAIAGAAASCARSPTRAVTGSGVVAGTTRSSFTGAASKSTRLPRTCTAS